MDPVGKTWTKVINLVGIAMCRISIIFSDIKLQFFYIQDDFNHVFRVMINCKCQLGKSSSGKSLIFVEEGSFVITPIKFIRMGIFA